MKGKTIAVMKKALDSTSVEIITGVVTGLEFILPMESTVPILRAFCVA